MSQTSITRSAKPERKWLALGVFALWIIGAITSYSLLNVYAHTPGQPADTSPQWPEQSTLKLAKDRDTLLLFIHPRCTCSRSTLWELNRLLPHLGDKMAVTVVFDWPPGKDERWYQNSNWEIAKSFSGVKLVADQNSQEFRRFKVNTSGQALLFSSQGQLLFAGGLTPARGHMGDSKGRAVLLARASSEAIVSNASAVFGCATQSASSAKEHHER